MPILQIYTFKKCFEAVQHLYINDNLHCIYYNPNNLLRIELRIYVHRA